MSRVTEYDTRKRYPGVKPSKKQVVAQENRTYQKEKRELPRFERTIVEFLESHVQDVMKNFASRSQATNSIPYMEELVELFKEEGYHK